MPLKLCGEGAVRFVILCDDEQTARLLINAVHDTGTSLAADAREPAAAMPEQSVDECTARVSCGGVHDHARGLVDDEKILVLVDDVKRNFLRECVDFLRLGRLPDDFVSLREQRLFCGGGAVDKNRAALCKTSRRRAGDACGGGEISVQPHTCGRCVTVEGHSDSPLRFLLFFC